MVPTKGHRHPLQVGGSCRRALVSARKTRRDLDLSECKIYVYNVYPKRFLMQVAKWGNSLAVRLPKTVVDALKLRVGDEIEITIAGRRQFEIGRDRKREDALKRLRALQRPLPPGFKFNREEAHER